MGKERESRGKIAVLALICVILSMMVLGLVIHTAVSWEKGEENQTLENEIDQKEQKIAELTEENQTLQEENATLRQENEDLKAAEENANSQAEVTEADIHGSVDSLWAGETIDPAVIQESNLNEFFKGYDIAEGDPVYQRIYGKSFPMNYGEISIKDLQYLKVIYWDAEHSLKVGEMIVSAEIAQDMLAVMKDLYQSDYALFSVNLVEKYWAGENGLKLGEQSIQAKNTFCFNYQNITEDEETLSIHAEGRAVKIFPVGEIAEGDACVTAFTSRGFTWGGNDEEIDNPSVFLRSAREDLPVNVNDGEEKAEEERVLGEEDENTVIEMTKSN